MSKPVTADQETIFHHPAYGTQGRASINGKPVLYSDGGVVTVHPGFSYRLVERSRHWLLISVWRTEREHND